MVLGTVILPDQYMGPVMDLCGARRGEQLEYTYIDEARVIVKYILPLGEIVKDFHDELKGRSSGYARLVSWYIEIIIELEMWRWLLNMFIFFWVGWNNFF